MQVEEEMIIIACEMNSGARHPMLADISRQTSPSPQNVMTLPTKMIPADKHRERLQRTPKAEKSSKHAE